MRRGLIVNAFAAGSLICLITPALGQGVILPDPVKSRPVLDTQLACTSHEELTKAIKLSVDEGAFKSYVAPKIMARACIFVEQGDEVFVTETAPSRAQYRVRKRGDHREFWVYRTALASR